MTSTMPGTGTGTRSRIESRLEIVIMFPDGGEVPQETRKPLLAEAVSFLAVLDTIYGVVPLATLFREVEQNADWQARLPIRCRNRLSAIVPRGRFFRPGRRNDVPRPTLVPPPPYRPCIGWGRRTPAGRRENCQHEVHPPRSGPGGGRSSRFGRPRASPERTARPARARCHHPWPPRR